uniref:Sulfur transfer protein involved in thiamine biosynthesis n=1 Tax=Desulfovibrio sp. U5L TaxID=596152 RepID=I2PZF5_9BACT
MITVTLGSPKQQLIFPKIKTVLQLLNKLNLRVNDALIIREDELLTPDRHLRSGDHVTVRPVTSRG